MGAPVTRGDCEAPHGVRPCPWEKCRYSLPRGNCALDFAAAAEELGGATLGEVAQALGISGEGVRTIEVRALTKLRLRLERDPAQIDIPPDLFQLFKS
jgi:hypothetical protein